MTRVNPNEESYKRLDQLQGDINRLLEAKSILEELYIHLGPYNPGIPGPLLQRLNAYFSFNDSE